MIEDMTGVSFFAGYCSLFSLPSHSPWLFPIRSSNRNFTRKMEETMHFVKKTSVLSLVLFTVMFIAYGPRIFASETKNSGSNTVEISKMVVEGKKIENVTIIENAISAELGEYGHPVEIITGKEMKEAGFVDLARALDAMVPGSFSYTRSGRGGYNYVSLHGSSDILWLLDGVRINVPGGKGYSMTISVHMIDRVEILKAGESLFYGTDSRSGIINIITKDITADATSGFGISYGSDDYREVFGHTAGVFSGHGLMVFGTHEAFGGYRVYDDQSYIDALNPNKRKTTEYDRDNIFIKYSKKFDLAGDSVLNAQLHKHYGHFDYPYPQYLKSFSDWDEEIASLKWDHNVNDTFSYNLSAFFHGWWSEATFMALDGSYSSGPEKSDAAVWGFEEYGANLITNTQWGNGHNIFTGIDYQNNWGKDDCAGNATPRKQVFGFFANYRPYLFFSPETKVSIGGRYNKVDGAGADSTVWDISIKTPLTDRIFLAGKMGTTFTLPTGRQLYYDDPANDRYGNPDLEPEEGFDVEVGIGGAWQHFQVNLDYFRQEIEDMIQSVTLDNGIRTYENADGETEIDGFEVSTDIGPFNGFSLGLSATWVDAEDEDSGEQREKIPEFYAKANIRYRNKKGSFGADIMSRYTGNLYERGLGAVEDINYGEYYLVDASTFLSFGKNKKHKITFRVENLFDEDYATTYNRTRNSDSEYFVYSQNGLPRSFILGYTYNY